MKAKVYVGAKKYALYIGRKITEKTLEFLTLPANFISNKVQELKDLIILGNSVQNGTPTPETPIQIESVGTRTKNLFNNINKGNRLGSIGELIAEATSNCTDFIPVNYGETYAASSIGTDGTSQTAWILCLYDENKDFIAQSRLVNQNDLFTFTIDKDNAKYLILSKRDVISKVSNIQLEEGTVATPYEPYGYVVPVTIEAKNYWKNLKSQTLDGVTIDVKDNGVIYTSGTCTKSNNFILSNITLEGDTYTLIPYANKNSISTDGQAFIQIYSPSTQINYSIKNNNLNDKITTELPYAEDYQFRFRIQEGVNYDGLIFKPVLEKGEYIEPIITNIYLNEPLRKIGEYSDYIDLENQKVVRNIGENIITGADCGGFYQGVNALRMTIGKLQDTTKGEIEIPFVSNSFIWGGFEANKGIANTITSSPLAVRCWMWFEYGTFTNNEEARAYIDTKNIIIYNVLATPIEETIDIPAINIPQNNLTININTTTKPTKIIMTGDIDNDN